MKSPALRLVTLLTAIAAASTGVATSIDRPSADAETVFHVAPSGKDSWSGRLAAPNADGTDGPLPSLAAARDAVRTLRAAKELTGPVRVVVATGVYLVDRPIVFGPGDGGSPDAPVVYEAAAGTNQKPVISGGRRIRGWKQAPNGLWQTKIDDVTAGKWRFHQLWVGGRRAVVARTPDRGQAILQQVKQSPTGTPAAPARHDFQLTADQLRPLTTLSTDELQAARIVIYHKWDVTRRSIHSIDPATHTLTTLGGESKPWNPLAKGSGFVLENYRDALDEGGEFFLAKDGTLTYKPRPGEEFSQVDQGEPTDAGADAAKTSALEVVAPVAESLLVIAGDSRTGEPIRHLKFRGLSFQHCEAPAREMVDFQPSQAAASISGSVAVTLDFAQQVELENCEVGHVGFYGIWFRRGCRDCSHSAASISCNELESNRTCRLRSRKTSSIGAPARCSPALGTTPAFDSKRTSISARRARSTFAASRSTSGRRAAKTKGR